MELTKRAKTLPTLRKIFNLFDTKANPLIEIHLTIVEPLINFLGVISRRCQLSQIALITCYPITYHLGGDRKTAGEPLTASWCEGDPANPTD